MGKQRKSERVIATIDCETDPFKVDRIPKPFLWDVFDGTTHYEFEHTSDCISFLSTKEWVCYAHNGGKFDYHQPGFLDELQEFDEIMVINGRLAKFTIGLCEFRDSVNILPIALKEFCKLEIDYAKLEANVRHRHMEEIRKYLRVDTESLYTLVTKFREEYGDGLTLAGSAMKFWQTRSMIDAPKSNATFYKEISPYYYGGRVEVFQGGIIDGPIYIFDINSAYPYAMLQHHPFSTESNTWNPGKRAELVPQSLYRVSGVSKGAFPMREKYSLRFPRDDTTREYCITGWELREAVETDTFQLDAVISRKDFIEQVEFSKYVNYFYDKKKAAAEKEGKNSKEYIFAKLFMNSLYGKFAACPDNYYNHSIVGRGNVPDTQCGLCRGKGCALCYGKGHIGMWVEGDLGKWVLMRKELEEHEKRFYNLATSASITGFVRAYLWRAICSIRKAGGSILYCDTDCVVFRDCMPSDCGLSQGKELGQWSSEGIFSEGGIAGRKLYAFKESISTGNKQRWKYASKGARLEPEQIVRISDGAQIVYKQDAPVYSIRGQPTFLERKIRKTV